jgi:hypothetical protein
LPYGAKLIATTTSPFVQPAPARRDKFARHRSARQLSRLFIDEFADALLIALRGTVLARVGLLEDCLEVGEAREAEALGEAHNSRWMHAARARDVAGAIHHHVAAMLFDVSRHAFKLARQRVVRLGDPQHQFVDCQDLGRLLGVLRVFLHAALVVCSVFDATDYRYLIEQMELIFQTSHS